MSKVKTVGKLKASQTNVSGVKILKNFTPNVRRNRQCEKINILSVEVNNDKTNVWDAITSISPPPAFCHPLGKTITSY